MPLFWNLPHGRKEESTQAFIGGATWEVFRVALVPALVWRADGKGAGGLCFCAEVVLLSFWTFWSGGGF